jgi:beta-lactamase regulating signal transducer with metallopeptidase domain
VLGIFSALSRFTAEIFVAGLWQGFALILAVALALRLFSRIPASVRFTIWSLAFALAVTIPLLQLQAPAGPIGQSRSAVFHISPGWSTGIAVLWACLTAARLAQFAIQSLRLRLIWKRSIPLAPTETTHATIDSTGRNVELCTSTDVDTPCVIGFFSPRLLIPNSLLGTLTPSDLHQIVLHECEHLRRRDDWINLAQKLALAIFPLNPALLFADRRLSLERELACDAGVIARTDAPFDYARCLTRLAEHRLNPRRLSLALSAWSRQSELACRVHTLLRPIHKLSRAYTQASISAFTIALAAGAVELAHAPRLVSFASPVVPTASGVDTIFRSASPTEAIPVVYKQGAADQPRVTLLKATMPLPKATGKPPSPNAAKHTLKQVHHPASAKHPQTRMLRTTAHQSSRYVSNDAVPGYYVTTEFSHSYATFPFGDGWLIVQL